MNNAQANINTSDRKPTPVRPVSQSAPTMHHTVAPTGRQMKPWPHRDHITLQSTFTTRYYSKEASCHGEPSEYIHPNHQ